MLNFYEIVKTNLSFNRFQYEDTVCLEYTCPIEAEDVGIFSCSDYVVHVLSGKKTYKTADGKWTLEPGQTLYLKKGAELIHQYFDDEYCMLGFFLSDDLIKETFTETKSKMALPCNETETEFTGNKVDSSEYLEGYFQSMLMYFRGENRPPDHIMVIKLKELLVNLMSSDACLATYFDRMSHQGKPSIRQVMEKNYCYNLNLENFAELCHCSLSTFKREFQQIFNETPGRWLMKRKIQHAANLLSSSSLNVSQIAYESGFEDLSHFSRAFKKELGSSPSEYKKSLISPN